MHSKSSDLDLAPIPLVDNHCHLFHATFKPHDLPSLFSMSLNDMPADQVRQTLVFRRLMRELALLLQLAGASDAALMSRRAALMAADYGRWVRGLFQDANIRCLIVDTGYQPADQSLQEFEELVPADVYYMFRIESRLDDLWQQFNNKNLTLEDIEEKYDRELEMHIAGSRTVALKSIIGYRTGIEIQPVERRRLKQGPPAEKAFRDYFFLRTLEKAAQSGLPVQIHASFGESNIDVRRNHPAMLKWVFDQPAFRGVPMVIVHGGYPHCFEAGYLASVYPNVYVDFSEMNPFVPLGFKKGLRDIFDMCPFNKILYGSDGFVVPEIHWLAARMARAAMADLLASLVEDGLFDIDSAFTVAKMVFEENAVALYRLPAPGAAEKVKTAGREA